jgi:thiamine biosynthesis lipoprotein
VPKGFPLTGFFVLLYFCACARDEVQLFSEKQVMMDTLVSITIYAETEPPHWREHIRAAFDAMRKIEALTSSYDDSSEIGKINLNAGRRPVAVSPQVLHLIRESQKISARTGGAFDITVWPLSRLWDVKSPAPRVPPADQIEEKRKLVDYRRIVLNGASVFLPENGMGLDLGAIAKGFAVDCAAQVLREYDYQDFLVEAGGDLRAAAGDATRGRRTVWVRHPRQREKFFAAIKMDAGAVSTSGDYERSFEKEGQRYHHILDPQSGYPAAPTVSATVIAETSELADAASTAAFVMGPERGLEYIESHPELAGLIIYREASERGEVLNWKISKNLVDKINIIEN